MDDDDDDEEDEDADPEEEDDEPEGMLLRSCAGFIDFLINYPCFSPDRLS